MQSSNNFKLAPFEQAINKIILNYLIIDQGRATFSERGPELKFEETSRATH